MRAAAADTLRLYPDPQSTRLREALADYHGVAPEQVFVGNGSDEVLAHAFAALLKQPSAGAVSRRHLQLLSRLVPAVGHRASRRSRSTPRCACASTTIRDRGGAIILANPNAPTGIALPRAEIDGW